MNKLKIFLLVCAFSSFNVWAQKEKKADESVILPDTSVIDIPTSGIIDYYGFTFRSRFYNGGGVLTHLNFGVLERLNFGSSFMVDKLVGSESPVKMVRPEIQIKFRFYDGGMYTPSLAVGYDGQGYYYDRDLKRYMEKGKGLYLAGSRELFAEGLMCHAGLNVPEFDDGRLFSFLGLNYTIDDRFAILAEYDSLFHRNDSKRFNLGMRFYITPRFNLDVVLREIGRNDKFSNGWDRKPERIIQFSYLTGF